ncbi:glycosyltransferase family 4 protein [Arenibaculum pallidiluteum]|uniref:glycosyltransferase family 4 protein n=1 Tax=Arenibaculum pallidiluteum TaxID=2812559 RepID=UPI001A962E22|nr:glycosyltransferase family 4 protein [Arenibaculum pallidiluteum]
MVKGRSADGMEAGTTSRGSGATAGGETIAVLLPYAEAFARGKAGAVALSVNDELGHSRYRDAIAVYGRPVEQPLQSRHFHAIEPLGRWFRGRNIGLAEAFRRAAQRSRPALVELHNRPLVFRHLARRLGQTIVTLHLHNDPQDMKGARSAAERRAILDRAGAVYCVSDFVRRRFLEGLSGGEDKVHVLYYGIPRPWPAPPAKEDLILFVGRIIPDKGVLELVRALARVLPGHPGWRAAFVGGLKAGQESGADLYGAAVRREIEAIGPAARFLGVRPHEEVMELFARAAIVAVPSVWEEPFGRTAAEAVAAGCALVCSGRGGLPEIASGRGMVAEPTVEDLSRALSELVSDAPRRQALQDSAWRGFPFDGAAMTARHDDIRAALLGAG